MAISSIGVGSGLPIEQLLKDLRESENQPLVLIQSQQISAQNRISAYSTLKSALEALNTAGKALGKDDAFGALKATTAGDHFTASVTNKAVAGQYNIKVDTLATSQTLVATGQADRTAAIGTSGGTLSVTINGETKTLDVSGKDGGAPTLDDLMAAINGDSKLGFSATLINDGSDAPHRLLFTAKDTGTEASIESLSFAASDAGDSALNDLIRFDASTPGANTNIEQEAAVNAKILINNIEITSQSNKVEGAIEGVTLNLTKVTDTAVSLAVTRDDKVTTDAINKFVTAYNSLQTTIKSLTSYDVENQTGSALTGDNLARNAQNQVRQALNSAVSDGAISTLSQLGITTDPKDGTLKIDEKKLEEALKTNMVDVQKLFTGELGLSANLAKVADNFTRSDGLIKNAEDGTNRTISQLDKQFLATTERIDAKMEAYRKQFSGLDVMMSQMNGISNYLTQQLSMLGNIGKDK
ncbi:MAG: flagellar filament capping protein FliD [Burkholderiaceae bacterium]|nr:flagellar filament capping protein FliD [Burkholderiaceae bacterium]